MYSQTNDSNESVLLSESNKYIFQLGVHMTKGKDAYYVFC